MVWAEHCLWRFLFFLLPTFPLLLIRFYLFSISKDRRAGLLVQSKFCGSLRSFKLSISPWRSHTKSWSVGGCSWMGWGEEHGPYGFILNLSFLRTFTAVCLTPATEPGRLGFRETAVDREAPLKTQTHTQALVHPTDITRRECGTEVVLKSPTAPKGSMVHTIIELSVDDKKKNYWKSY